MGFYGSMVMKEIVMWDRVFQGDSLADYISSLL